jgi:hypothetical protein
MITTLPIVPANLKKLKAGDEILFRFVENCNGFLVKGPDWSKKVKRLTFSVLNFGCVFFMDDDGDKYSLHEGCFVPKENTEIPFSVEMGEHINSFPSYIYKAKNYYSFIFATLRTKECETGYKRAREFSDRLEVKQETESYNKDFLAAHEVTDLDSFIATVRPQ